MIITVLGGGSWGTAMAVHLAQMGHQLRLYVRSEIKAKQIRKTRRNSDYLGDIYLPENIFVCSSVEQALSGAQLIIGAIPAQAMESFYKENCGALEGLPYVSLSKGITNDKLETMEQLYKRYYPQGLFAALSGPSHAEEVARKVPTALVVAGDDEAFTKLVQHEFSNEFIRIYRSDDVLGVELSGAFKNVIALVVGMAVGCGLGDNTKAALMTRGMAEILRLALAMGAKQETFLGLSGFGDLIVTCTSNYSRNRRAGELLAQGYSEEEVKNKVGMVIEGLSTLRSVIRLAKDYHQSMPIAETLERVISGNLPIDEAMKELMMRDYKEEI
ncbi:MAG: NAD(P)-dependent glycerol-3-phosphate dehydrogenase [Tissierellia bacterium]|nr:NAD(P)-dependent glycerol-3-phosphate dehydrogenase [Tissierellia bacterium]